MKIKHTFSKKVFFGFFIALLLTTSVVGALSGIPHTHDSDFSHKNHENCALILLSSIHSDLHAGAFSCFAVLLFAGFILLFNFLISSQKPRFLFFLRAPPITL